MTDKELRKLNRAELLEMLLEQVEENEALNRENEELKAKLEEKKIVMEQAGSIAEAALRLNGVFEAAEAAAKQYLDSIQLMESKADLQRKYEKEAVNEAANEAANEADQDTVKETEIEDTTGLVKEQEENAQKKRKLL